MAKWNELANEDYQLEADHAHPILHDNSDGKMENQGCTLIEVRANQSRTGTPATFYIMNEEVTFA